MKKPQGMLEYDDEQLLKLAKDMDTRQYAGSTAAAALANSGIKVANSFVSP